MNVRFRSQRTCRCHRGVQGQRRRAASRAASTVGRLDLSLLEARWKLGWRDPTAQRGSAIVARRTHRHAGRRVTYRARLETPKKRSHGGGLGMEQRAESGEVLCGGGGSGARRWCSALLSASTYAGCWGANGKSAGQGPKRRRLVTIMEKDGSRACGRASTRKAAWSVAKNTPRASERGATFQANG